MLSWKRETTHSTRLRTTTIAAFHCPVSLAHVDKYLSTSLPKQLTTWVEKYWRVYLGYHMSSSILHDTRGHDGLKMFHHLRLPQVSEEGWFFSVGFLGCRRNHTGSRAPPPHRGDTLQALPWGSAISFSSDLQCKPCSVSSCTFLLTLVVSNLLAVLPDIPYTIWDLWPSSFFIFLDGIFFFPSRPSFSFWVTLLPQTSPSHTQPDGTMSLHALELAQQTHVKQRWLLQSTLKEIQSLLSWSLHSNTEGKNKMR